MNRLIRTTIQKLIIVNFVNTLDISRDDYWSNRTGLVTKTIRKIIKYEVERETLNVNTDASIEIRARESSESRLGRHEQTRNASWTIVIGSNLLESDLFRFR